MNRERIVVGLPIVLAACVVALAGCGAVVAPGRLDVTDALRTACADFAGGDANISALINNTEEARLAGFSRTAVASDLPRACAGPFTDISIRCARCGLAVVAQVYGQ